MDGGGWVVQLAGEGVLLHVDLGEGRKRLGGSALAHVYDQVSKKMGTTLNPLASYKLTCFSLVGVAVGGGVS